MTARGMAALGLGAVVVAVALVIALGGNSDSYLVRLQMENANGLRAGRPVKVGGADVGKVKHLRIGRGDQVIAELAVDPHKATIGTGASAEVKPTNLLGERYVALTPGDLRSPQPSGSVIPSSRVTSAVDLDQVIDVLDPDTRARLGILINEAGLAFTGRRADFNRLLSDLPPALGSATKLLDELVNDNHTLGDLVTHSDRAVAQFTAERQQLSKMIGVAGKTMETFSARQAALRETLVHAPGALSSLRSFLAELQQTTEPLGPAARAISASAPSLSTTLSELEPFQRAAKPTLAQATASAPQLTQLGRRATPVIRQASAPLRALSTFADTAQPVIQGLHHGTGINKIIAPGPVDDLLNITATWARAIQTRDDASHIFRGYVTVGPETIAELIKRYALTHDKAKARRGSRPTPSRLGSATTLAQKLKDRAPKRSVDLDSTLKRVDSGVRKAVDNITKGLHLPDLTGGGGSGGSDQSSGGSASTLLDFLLKP